MSYYKNKKKFMVYVNTVSGQKFLLPPRFPFRTYVKPLFVECL